MSVSLSAIQAHFAGLAMPPIRRVYTSASLPLALSARDLPVLMPDPAAPLASSQSMRLTVGGAGWARRRALNYVCLVAEAGAERNPATNAERLSACIEAVENAFCDDLPPSVHGMPEISIGGAGLLAGPDGKQYYGFTVTVNVTVSY